MQAEPKAVISAVEYVNITPEVGAGQRIDNFLATKLKGIPKSKIYSILRTGEVRVNKGRIKPSYRLQANDIVRVPPLREATPTTEEYTPSVRDVAQFKLESAVIFENQNYVIMNKPVGLAVHGGSGLKFGLIEMLRALRPQEANLSLVHRIDRETSGCVLLAKNMASLRGMHQQFRDGKVQKTYHTLVKGFVAGDFQVDVALKKFVLSSGERMVRVNAEEGQSALTNFVLLERYPGVSLLQASPITGRTHQIRVHAAHRGYPIVGDEKYGNKVFNQTMRAVGCKRLYLHARQLVFTCPITGELIAAQAEYDRGWEQGIKSLHKGI